MSCLPGDIRGEAELAFHTAATCRADPPLFQVSWQEAPLAEILALREMKC